MKFDKSKQQYIDETFKLVNQRLALQSKDVLTEQSLENILFALHYRHDRIGSMGPRNHELMFSVFKALGYCRDGKTTLKEAELRAKRLKEAEKKEREKKKREQAAALQEQIKLAELHIQELQKSEEDLQVEFEEIKATSAKQLKEKLAAKEKEIIAKLAEKGDAIVSNLKSSLTAADAQRFEDLTPAQIEQFYTKSELVNMVHELGLKASKSATKAQLVAIILKEA
jgi:hypothetical protein